MGAEVVIALAGVVLYLGIVTFTLALARVAGRADERMGAK